MTKKKKEEILFVTICEAKPNKLFTEEQRQGIRFLKYNKFIACAECGKKRKIMWTMLCQFIAMDFGSSSHSLAGSGKSHPPLTPVCGEHPIAPDWPTEKAKKV